MECCVIGCSGDPGSGIQGFYNFPRDNHRKLEWLNAIGRLEEEINVLSALCSSHFTEECFEFTPQGMLLKINAIPDVKVIKREEGVSHIVRKRKHNVIVVSTATVRIKKTRRISDSDDIINVEKLSQMNIIDEIIKEYNSDLSRKKHLYILESEPHNIKDDSKLMRLSGYNLHVRDESDTNYNNGYDSDTIDTKGNIKLAADSDTDRDTDYRSDLTNIQAKSKKIIRGTLQRVIDNEIPEESYVLIENTQDKEPEKEILSSKEQTTKKRKPISRVVEIAPVSETMEVHQLTQEQQLQRIKDALESGEFLKNPHRCYKCGISFMREFHYRQHMIRHDKTYGTFECTVCDSYYPRRKVLSAHKLHKHQLLFRCKLCAFETRTRHNAKMHTCGATESKTYPCEFCNRIFSKVKTLYDHKHRWHKSDDYVCSICGAKFNNPKGLRVHYSICQRQVYECQSCLHKFRDQHELLLHQQSHSLTCRKNPPLPDAEAYRCDKCDLDIPTRRSYLQHMSRKHPPEGAPLFRCEECNRNFKSKLTFKVHMEMAARHIKPEAFRFQCDRCSAVFARKIELIEHLQIHTNEKNYRCPICDKAFRIRASLWQHKRYSHGGGKPKIHPCTFCDRRFNSKGTLLIHIRSHTAEKPFVCDVCGNGFASNCSLTQHIKGVHLKILPKRAKRQKSRNKESGTSDPGKEGDADDVSTEKKALQIGMIRCSNSGTRLPPLKDEGFYQGHFDLLRK